VAFPVWLVGVAIALNVGVLVCVFLLLGRNKNDEIARLLSKIEQIEGANARFENAISQKFGEFRGEQHQQSTGLRTEVQNSILGLGKSTADNMSKISELQAKQLEAFEKSMKDNLGNTSVKLQQFSDTLQQQQEALRTKLDTKLTELRNENTKKLDEIRVTVDEKLQTALEKRLGEAFKQVSERLEKVHEGLGEMQSLASGVGDLKRVLTNVKTRGSWGEFVLGDLLADMLTPEQYEKNVRTNPASSENVEYAVKLPGTGQDAAPVYIPIDSKFPKEDYERILQASETGDAAGVVSAEKQLQNAIKKHAKDISTKYIHPPHTTDFAIMFLPTEGLYAEALRASGFVDAIQRENRVVIAGPTTFSAMLRSLQMGFRTLAIEKRSSEVWEMLSAVKTEFGKFGDILAKVRKKLDEASRQMDQVDVRTRAMTRKLSKAEELPEGRARDLLQIEGAFAELADEDDQDAAE